MTAQEKAAPMRAAFLFEHRFCLNIDCARHNKAGPERVG
jgi:hypothetical protein